MSKFLSRKLLALAITMVVGLIGKKLGLDDQTVDLIGTSAVAYILGQSAVDAAAAFKGTKA